MFGDVNAEPPSQNYLRSSEIVFKLNFTVYTSDTFLEVSYLFYKILAKYTKYHQ